MTTSTLTNPVIEKMTETTTKKFPDTHKEPDNSDTAYNSEESVLAMFEKYITLAKSSSTNVPGDLSHGFPAKEFINRAHAGDLLRHLKKVAELHGIMPPCIIEALLAVTCDEFQRTLLHWVAHHNATETMEWILKHSAVVLHLNDKDIFGYTALHLATREKHEAMVKVPATNIRIAAENMSDHPISNGFTSLHFAATNGSYHILKIFHENGKLQVEDICAKSLSSGKTVLHYAVEGGEWRTVRYLLEVLKMWKNGEVVNSCDIWRQTPLHTAAFKQNVEVVEILLREGEGLKVNATTWQGITALDMAKKHQNYRIVEMLESYDVTWLLGEREKYANAANCLLVGAALIAAITYAGWLQPPLGYTEYYNFPVSTPGPDTTAYQSYVGVSQHWEIQMFWFFNSLSFFCSVATFIIGADAGIPDKCATMREEVLQLRNSVVKASFILTVAIVFVIIAFSSAGIVVLPPIPKQRLPMYFTVVVGVGLCFILLIQFLRKLWMWFRSPSLQLKETEDIQFILFNQFPRNLRIWFRSPSLLLKKILRCNIEVQGAITHEDDKSDSDDDYDRPRPVTVQQQTQQLQVSEPQQQVVSEPPHGMNEPQQGVREPQHVSEEEPIIQRVDQPWPKQKDGIFIFGANLSGVAPVEDNDPVKVVENRASNAVTDNKGRGKLANSKPRRAPRPQAHSSAHEPPLPRKRPYAPEPFMPTREQRCKSVMSPSHRTP